MHSDDNNDNDGVTNNNGNTGNTGNTGTGDTTGGDGNGDGTTIVLCDDGSLPPCLTNPNSGDGTMSGADDASGEINRQNIIFLLFGMIGAMGIGLYLISKTGGDKLNLNEEATIEKIWDETELETPLSESTFIPAPPPMKAKSDSSEKE